MALQINAPIYRQRTRRGLSAGWITHPRRMLRHKSMVQCARLSFGLVGIYDADEAESKAAAIEQQEMNLDHGQVTNASFADYKIPGMNDLPLVFENEVVQAYQANAPYGAKGVGESATFGVSPAIANAIDDAVGVRIFELPITGEAILSGLQQQINHISKE